MILQAGNRLSAAGYVLAVCCRLLAIRLIAVWPAAIVIATAMVIGGCNGKSGSLRAISSGDDRVALPLELRTAVYRFEPGGNAVIVLSDLPAETIESGRIGRGQILIIEMLWLPVAGVTPPASTATNATFRHFVISDDQVGVYVGGGFVLPEHRAGARRVTASVRDASLQLGRASAGFADLLSPAQIFGKFSVQLDVTRTRSLEHAVGALDRRIIAGAG